MALLLALLLAQAPIDSLIRDLGHDSIEVRERAHRQLIEAGEAALPALEIAVRSCDAELRVRAGAILEIVGRESRERAYDADQKAALLLLRRDKNQETWPGSSASEGARFDVRASSFDGGWVLSVTAFDYLVRRPDPGPGRGQLVFDVASIRDASGRDAVIERCGLCSPRKVFVRGAEGPLLCRLTGSQVWFTPYALEFHTPTVEDSKRVGNFSIAVVEDGLRISSESDWPKEWLRSMDQDCGFTLKPGVTLRRPRIFRCGGRINEIERPIKRKSWCDCPTGPQSLPLAFAPVTLRQIVIGKRLELAGEHPEVEVIEHCDLKLHHLERITYTFWKPHVLPIDLTVTVPTR